MKSVSFFEQAFRVPLPTKGSALVQTCNLSVVGNREGYDVKAFFALLVLSSCSLMGYLPKAEASEAPPNAPILVDDIEHWRLPEGHFVGAKMPMTVVHPRSFPTADGGDETRPWARHKKAYPGIEYRIPISIQGGAYPFHYEIMEAPSWLFIGSTVWEQDYGELHGIAPTQTGGPYTVRVKITDQELTERVVEFPLTVTSSTADFIFVDVNAPTSGNGSIGSPFNNLTNDIFAGGYDNAPTPYAGRIVYLRGGTHNFMEDDWHKTNMQYHVRGDWNPLVYLGYPGEDVTINFSRARMIARELQEDMFWGGLTLEDTAISGQSNFIEVWSMTRFTWFDLNLRKLNKSPSGSNEGGIFTKGASILRPYWTFWRLRISEAGADGLGAFFSIGNAVFEDIKLAGGGPTHTHSGIMLKGVASYVSIRRVDGGFEGNFKRPIRNYNGRLGAHPVVPRYVEISYSRVGMPEGSPRNEPIVGMLITDNADATTSPPSEIWAYRNTVIGGYLDTEGNPYGHFYYLNNAVFANRTPPLFRGSTNQSSITIEGNLTGSYADRTVYLDENYQLKGVHRETWLGKVGHEIHR